MRLTILATLSLGFLPVCLLAQNEARPSGIYELGTVVQRGSERVWFQPVSRTGFASSEQGKLSGSYAIVYNPQRRESIRAKLSVVGGKKVYELQDFKPRESNPFQVHSGYGIGSGLSARRYAGVKQGVPGTYFGFQNTEATTLPRLTPSFALKLELGHLPETASEDAIKTQWRQAGSFLLGWLESQGYTAMESKAASLTINGPPPAGTINSTVLRHDYYALPAEQPAMGVWVESSVRATQSHFEKATILPSGGCYWEEYSWKSKEPWTTFMVLGLTQDGSDGEIPALAGLHLTQNWGYARIFRKAGKKYYQLGGNVGPSSGGGANLQRHYLRTRGANGNPAALELLNSILVESAVEFAGEGEGAGGSVSQSSSNQLWGIWRPLKINDETTVSLPYSMVGLERGERTTVWPSVEIPMEDGETSGNISQNQSDFWTAAPKRTLHTALTREIAEAEVEPDEAMEIVISYLEDRGYVDFDAEPEEEEEGPVEE